MKILFYTPIDIYKNWPLVNDTTRYRHTIPGCAFPQLAAMVPEHECKIFDGSAYCVRHKINKNEIIKLIKDFDVIGMNVVSEFTSLNTEVNLNLIKEISPSVKVILGGYHATFFHQQWCEKGADFVVRHEGERTFFEIINKLEGNEKLNNVLGITYKDKGEIVINDDRPFVSELDSLPLPQFGLLDYSLYKYKPISDGYAGCIEISRGCPHQCSFCWNGPMWRFTQRYKSAERVIEEIKVVLSNNVKWLWFADTNFGSNYNRDMAICEGIIRNSIKVSWGAFMRADSAYLHPDLVKLASKSGMKEVSIGFEFTNREMIEKIDKGYNNFDFVNYKRAYQVFKENNIFVVGNFLTGFPNETHKWSFKHCQEICDFATWNSLRPQYKTTVYEDLLKTNEIKKNMFYHSRFFPLFEKKKDYTIKYNLLTLFYPKTIKKILFGKNFEKSYILNVISVIMKSVLDIRFQKLQDFIILTYPFFTIDEKEKIVVRKYLDKKFLKKWLK